MRLRVSLRSTSKIISEKDQVYIAEPWVNWAYIGFQAYHSLGVRFINGGHNLMKLYIYKRLSYTDRTHNFEEIYQKLDEKNATKVYNQMIFHKKFQR